MGIFDSVEDGEVKQGMKLAVKKAPPTSLDKLLHAYEEICALARDTTDTDMGKVDACIARMQQIPILADTITDFCMKLPHLPYVTNMCDYFVSKLVASARKQGHTDIELPLENMRLKLQGEKAKLPFTNIHVYGGISIEGVCNARIRVTKSDMGCHYRFLRNVEMSISGAMGNVGQESKNCFFKTDGWHHREPLRHAKKCTLVSEQSWLGCPMYSYRCTFAFRDVSTCEYFSKLLTPSNHIYHIQDDGTWKAYRWTTKVFGWMRRKNRGSF